VSSTAAFEKSLSLPELKRHLDALQADLIALDLPKFTFGLKADMVRTLTDLGLGVAFTDVPDFSGITTTDKLQITNVVHQAVIKTDEAGTEAAAATGVGIGVTGMPDPILVDRPFLFVIRDVATGAIVFLGRVVEPG